MALDNIFEKSVINFLSTIQFSNLNNYALKYKEHINFLYNNGTIDDSSIDKGLEKGVLNQAKSDYDLIIGINENRKRKGDSPFPAEDLPMPEFFAYGIQKNKFSEKELSAIPWGDAGETKESFMKAYFSENLIPTLREVFLNPEESGKINYNGSVCLGH